MSFRIRASLLLAAAAVLGGARAQAQAPADPAAILCRSLDRVDTRSWSRVRIGGVRFRVPPSYRRHKVQGIDSALGAWRGRNGQEISTDYGIYGAPFQAISYRVHATFAVCQGSDGVETPQIVTFRTAKGEYGVGFYWVVPGGRAYPYGPNRYMQREALSMMATSPRAEDIPTLLAVARSVQPAR